MCRMLAAVGRLDVPVLRRSLMLMAANDNPAYDHEHRREGAKYRHEDGWGAAWLEGGALRIRRTPLSALKDPRFAEVDAIQSDLLVLHARRASKPRSVRLENTHPFLLRYMNRTWAFCHNGAVREIQKLLSPSGLVPGGGTDSEKLFHHILLHLDPEEPEESILAALAPIRDYTAMLCFLASPERVLAVAQRNPNEGRPGYHALFRGEGDGFRIVSSEPLDGIGVERWERVADPGVVVLERAKSA